MYMDKHFAHSASDLTDREITEVFKVVNVIRVKYAGLPNTADNLEKLRDEALTRLMEIGIIATLDPAPVFYGEPPTLEVIGKLDNSLFTDGFDHEQKGWEVNKANDRDEDWLGQKESIDKLKDKGKKK